MQETAIAVITSLWMQADNELLQTFVEKAKQKTQGLSRPSDLRYQTSFWAVSTVFVSPI